MSGRRSKTNPVKTGASKQLAQEKEKNSKTEVETGNNRKAKPNIGPSRMSTSDKRKIPTHDELKKAIADFNRAPENAGRVELRMVPKTAQRPSGRPNGKFAPGVGEPSPPLAPSADETKPSHRLKAGFNARALHSADQFMEDCNHYLASLRDPVHNANARIPDGAGSFDTAVIQIIYHSQVTNNASSTRLAGICIGNHSRVDNGTTGHGGPYMVPQVGLTSALDGFAVLGATHLETDSATTSSTTTNLFPDSTTAGSGAKPITMGTLASFLDSYASYCRVVSAGMRIVSTASATSNTGYYVGASLPPEAFGQGAMNFSLAQLQNTLTSLTVPVTEALGGIECTYTPLDQRSYEFAKTGITSAVATADDTNINLNPGMMCLLAVGGSEGTVYLYDIAINYELVVQSGQILLDTNPSIDDPNAMAEAQNARQMDALVFKSRMFNKQYYGSDISGALAASGLGSALVNHVGTGDSATGAPGPRTIILHSQRGIQYRRNRRQGRGRSRPFHSRDQTPNTTRSVQSSLPTNNLSAYQADDNKSILGNVVSWIAEIAEAL